MKRAGVSATELAHGGIHNIAERVGNLRPLAGELGIGLPTLGDIIAELAKPGRDPREDAPSVVFSSSVRTIDDLQVGMELVGTVRNVVDFGVFVDIGLKQSGLVHISRLANHFVKHPGDVAAVGDNVKVWVCSVDKEREKIALTMVESIIGA